MVGFVAFFAWLGFGGDYIYHLYTLGAPRRAYHHDFPWLGIGVALVHDGASRLFRPGGGSRDEGRKPRPLLLLLLIVWIVSWILAPIIAQLLALGVSRKREYLADAMSAQFTRNPLALASALQKIEGAEAPTTHIKRGAAHLCIADPPGRRLTEHEGLFADALATHPPMAKRIAILKGMGYAQLKKEGGAIS